MENTNTITITATADGEEKKVTFHLIKKEKTVCVKTYHKEEYVGDMEIKLDDFNNFCSHYLLENIFLCSLNRSKQKLLKSSNLISISPTYSSL